MTMKSVAVIGTHSDSGRGREDVLLFPTALSYQLGTHFLLSWIFKHNHFRSVV